MEDNELKAIQEAISRQTTNNYPQIYIQDLQGGRVFEYGKNTHDRLVISEDGRSLHYENLQNGDGSECGDYRFYYEKPKIETEMDKMHEWDLDRWARSVKNKSLDKFQNENQALKNRWQKLKEWVEKKYSNDYIDANDTEAPLTAQEYYGGSADTCRRVLDKMQELEKE